MNPALFLHILGAGLLVGALLTAAVTVRTSSRLAFKVLVLAALPSYVLMRIAAEIVRSKQNLDDEVAWIGIGYMTSETGFLLLVAATITAYLTQKRTDAGGLGKATMVMSLLVVALYTVAVWAMTTKPL
ncbi:MAG: hypothetical protein H0V29_00550 [Thermoleophilaceae bacterium]|nr:hypothetical protein [Thermoleophilaceae bacterium]